ncbi:uncharacterized protein K02A2.6-like [Ylistrum balloti]|uniref:uncharacterized protein K02A2.6-like n=1 Tax=Ylistrum balloti TaxID=509963 RepID=UPI002905E7BF|nr:uncharacterized protein K02A2.6-like [Ylistrum balloti]
MIATELPIRPWSKIGVNLFNYNNESYLLTVDYFSKWPEIVRLESTTAKCVILHMKSQMAKYGIPDVVISDNGPQFACFEFIQFSKQYQFERTTSNPHYPQSNGQAERTVQTVKRLLKKSNDPYLALLEYRNSNIDEVGLSPAQMFLGRRLKSTIPTSLPLLKAEALDKVREQLVKRKKKQQQSHDRHVSGGLQPLSPGDQVLLKQHPNRSEWKHGTIIEKHKTPRSYVVRSGNRAYRRNRRHLRPTRSKADLEQEPTDFNLYCWPPSNQHQYNTSPAPNLPSKQTVSKETSSQDSDVSLETRHAVQNQLPPTSVLHSPRQSSSGKVIKTPGRFKNFVQ